MLVELEHRTEDQAPCLDVFGGFFCKCCTSIGPVVLSCTDGELQSVQYRVIILHESLFLLGLEATALLKGGADSDKVSAAISGLALGAFFFIPLAQLVERWSIILWSLLGCLTCAVWSVRITAESDYVPFIISRLSHSLLTNGLGKLG